MRLFAAFVSIPRSHSLISSLLLVGVTAVLTNCGSSPKQTTDPNQPPPTQPTYPSTPPVPITWSPGSSDLPAPPAQEPPPGGSDDFPLTVSSPTNSSTVTSPLNVVASAQPKNPIFFMRVYVDELAVYFTFNSSINTQIFAAPGQHTITVMAEDNQGYISAIPLTVTVSSQAAQNVISSIQNLPGWQSCGALFPPGSGRAGQLCAAGDGTPSSTMTQGVTSPSMDGKAAEFSIAPQPPACTGYCNMLYFNPIAGGSSVSHFLYDVYFYIDDPSAPRALPKRSSLTPIKPTAANAGSGARSATSRPMAIGTFGMTLRKPDGKTPRFPVFTPTFRPTAGTTSPGTYNKPAITFNTIP